MPFSPKSAREKGRAQDVRVSEIDELSSRLLSIDLELNSNIPTTLWISDLHGEGDRFKSILRGRFGMLFQTCKEALPSTFSAEKKSSSPTASTPIPSCCASSRNCPPIASFSKPTR